MTTDETAKTPANRFGECCHALESAMKSDADLSSLFWLHGADVLMMGISRRAAAIH